MDVDGDSLKTSSKIFFRFFTLFVISFVPTWIITSSGFLWSSIFSRIYSLVPPEKFSHRYHYNGIFRDYNVYYYVFYSKILFVWFHLFCYELGLDFACSVFVVFASFSNSFFSCIIYRSYIRHIFLLQKITYVCIFFYQHFFKTGYAIL